jgi:hypothetical protein
MTPEPIIVLCSNTDHVGNSTHTHCHDCNAPIVVAPSTYLDTPADRILVCINCGLTRMSAEKTIEVRMGPNQLADLHKRRLPNDLN